MRELRSSCRRTILDRRTGGSSEYTGPERRGLKCRRSDLDRRKELSTDSDVNKIGD